MTAALLAVGLFAAQAVQPPVSQPEPQPEPQREAGAAAATAGSLATFTPLGRRRAGLSLGGGLAVLLPFYQLEAGYGVSRAADLVARYETVLGVLHFGQLGGRWSPLAIGRFRLGLRLAASYTFFGLARENVNFTSTFYLTGEAGLSGPITRRLDLLFAVASELDLAQHDRLDGASQRRFRPRYDASSIRFGITHRTDVGLDLFLLARLRVPVEAWAGSVEFFYVIPFLEAGAAWSW